MRTFVDVARSVAAALVVGTVVLAAPAQDSQPDVPRVAVKVWTCAAHENVRMPAKGACPLCEGKLAATKLVIRDGRTALDPYPLDTCPVSGGKLGSMGEPVVMAYEDREVRFCCKGCIGAFEKDAEAYWEQIDEKIVEQQLAHYPLETCIVSGEPLGGEQGEPVQRVFGNRLVRFCCNGCVRAFKKDPAPHVAALDRAIIAAQREAYPLATCVVSDEKLGSMGEPVDLVVGNQLMRLCCNGCLADVWKSPAAYAARLGHARGARHGRDHGRETDHDPNAEGHDHDKDGDHGDGQDHGDGRGR